MADTRSAINKFLLPTLRRGDIVVMDNLAAHKVAGEAEVIKSIGAQVLYLPPCSPDLTPIAPMFAKPTASLRKAEERIIDDLWTRIGTLLTEVFTQECANDLAMRATVQFDRKIL